MQDKEYMVLTSEKPWGKVRPCGRLFAIVLVTLLAAFALCSLSGCKYSDVLTQHLEDPDKGVLDESRDAVYQPNPDSELVLDLAEVSLEESEVVDTQARVMPHYDPAAPDNGPTTQRLYSEETPHEEEASEGEEQEEEGDREGEGEGDEDGKSDTSDDTKKKKDDEKDKTDEDNAGNDESDDTTDDEDSEDNPNDSDDENDEGEGEGTETIKDDETDEQSEEEQEDGGGSGSTVIVDPDQGTTEETAKGTVAAVGEYATITQMLGGAGALAAADEDWLAARAADGCFSGELDQVAVGFSGDGTGSVYVDLLVNEIKPSVVLWDGSAPALTSDDMATLEAAGIQVQAVPTLGEQTTEDYTVTQAVQEVASVLSGAAGLSYDPVEMARLYVEFHDETLRMAYNDNGGYSYKATDSSYPELYQSTPLSGLDNSTTTRLATVYIDDIMTPSASTATLSQNAYLTDGSIQLLHDGEEVDVSDGVGLSSTMGTSSYMLIDYYLQLAGVMNNAYDTAQPEAQGRSYILMPGSTNAFGTSNKYAARSTASAMFYNSGDGTVRANWHWLGNADFPAIITANTDIAAAINASASKSDGLYRMDESYRIMVVPTGIAGSWAEGHLDSFLLTRWAFGLRDTSYLGVVEGDVTAFYGDFLRCPDWKASGAVSNWDDPIYTTEAG